MDPRLGHWAPNHASSRYAVGAFATKYGFYLVIPSWYHQADSEEVEKTANIVKRLLRAFKLEQAKRHLSSGPSLTAD